MELHASLFFAKQRIVSGKKSIKFVDFLAEEQHRDLIDVEKILLTFCEDCDERVRISATDSLVNEYPDACFSFYNFFFWVAFCFDINPFICRLLLQRCCSSVRSRIIRFVCYWKIFVRLSALEDYE